MRTWSSVFNCEYSYHQLLVSKKSNLDRDSLRNLIRNNTFTYDAVIRLCNGFRQDRRIQTTSNTLLLPWSHFKTSPWRNIKRTENRHLRNVLLLPNSIRM